MRAEMSKPTKEEKIAFLEREMSEFQCPDCQGGGQIPIGEHYVTREMAIDAGCLELEGAFYDIEWGRCPSCSGNGLILKEKGGKDG